jgi:hypothetical protein
MTQTRVNALGLSGNNSKYDTVKAIIEIDLSIQASASPINSNIFLTYGQILSAWIYTKTPETTGAVKTVSVGIAGGTGTELINAGSVSSAGINGSTTIPLTTNLADEITYTLGSADFAELEATLVLEVNQQTKL